MLGVTRTCVTFEDVTQEARIVAMENLGFALQGCRSLQCLDKLQSYLQLCHRRVQAALYVQASSIAEVPYSCRVSYKQALGPEQQMMHTTLVQNWPEVFAVTRRLHPGLKVCLEECQKCCGIRYGHEVQ